MFDSEPKLNVRPGVTARTEFVTLRRFGAFSDAPAPRLMLLDQTMLSRLGMFMTAFEPRMNSVKFSAVSDGRFSVVF